GEPGLAGAGLAGDQQGTRAAITHGDEQPLEGSPPAGDQAGRDLGGSSPPRLTSEVLIGLHRFWVLGPWSSSPHPDSGRSAPPAAGGPARGGGDERPGPSGVGSGMPVVTAPPIRAAADTARPGRGAGLPGSCRRGKACHPPSERTSREGSAAARTRRLLTNH